MANPSCDSEGCERAADYFLVLSKPRGASKATLIDRYPRIDRPSVTLEDKLALLTLCGFPRGPRRASPEFFIVVMAHGGQRSFGACLLFGETLLCVVSCWPLYGLFRRFLASLYYLCGELPAGSRRAWAAAPLEHYVVNFIDETPAPKVGECVEVALWDGGVARYSIPLPLSLPHADDLCFECLAAHLAPAVILDLVLDLVLEQSVVLLSSRLGPLALVGEALLALLFPFQWCFPYIPVLPVDDPEHRVLLGMPVPALLGIDKALVATLSPAFARRLEGKIRVDLDTGIVTRPAAHASDEPPTPLPATLRTRLLGELTPLLRRDALVGTFAPPMGEPKEWIAAMRYAFLRLFLTLIPDPTEYPGATPGGCDEESLVAATPATSRPLVRRIVTQTQAFAHFRDLSLVRGAHSEWAHLNAVRGVVRACGDECAPATLAAAMQRRARDGWREELQRDPATRDGSSSCSGELVLVRVPSPPSARSSSEVVHYRYQSGLPTLRPALCYEPRGLQLDDVVLARRRLLGSGDAQEEEKRSDASGSAAAAPTPPRRRVSTHTRRTSFHLSRASSSSMMEMKLKLKLKTKPKQVTRHRSVDMSVTGLPQRVATRSAVPPSLAANAIAEVEDEDDEESSWVDVQRLSEEHRAPHHRVGRGSVELLPRTPSPSSSGLIVDAAVGVARQSSPSVDSAARVSSPYTDSHWSMVDAFFEKQRLSDLRKKERSRVDVIVTPGGAGESSEGGVNASLARLMRVERELELRRLASVGRVGIR